MSIIKQKIKIEGMHCSSCAMVIDMDLEDKEGVKNSKTSYAKGETEVEFEPEKITLEEIVETIKKSGYQSQPIDKSK